ncbi:ABC transporter permease [Halomicrobium urmianum]|uniref:ABC transporter permease n=1 Tax=Halomicrobium urmianum TaxID=1586233 RepID=UPI001CD9FAB0|nr:ABC transporter permease subunit [Halomicrobium urmianum]
MSADRGDQVLALAQREFDALLRTPAYLLLAALFGLSVLAVPLLGGAGGYLPLVLNLATPVEVLVPVLAVGLGYRAVVADEARGELEVLRTYPIDRATYVAGTYLGRAALLAVAVAAPLVLGVLAVPLTDQPAPSFLASHATVDSPTYYARFAFLAVVYALVVLAVVMPLSAVARSRRRAVALAVTAVLLVVLGIDFALLAGVAEGLIGPANLGPALAASPASAFRGLVLSLAAAPVQSGSFPAPSPLPGAVSLLAWFVGSLALASVIVWSE